MTGIKDDPTNVDPSFIEENKQTNLVKPRKKFSPYTKAERTKRRQEVYRLHFERGLPVLKIATLMKVDKNTIYEDVRLLYREVDSRDRIDFSTYYNIQRNRLELQRGRLVEYLDKMSDIEKKVAIERLIADIDFRLLASAEKIEYNSAMFWDKVKDMFNRVAEKKGLDYRTTTVFELLTISAKARKEFDDLVRKAGLTPEANKKEGA